MRSAFLIAALQCVLLVGCQQQSPPPATQPAKGKVVMPDGAPLARAVVRFQSISDSNLIVSGFTGDDGTFSLETVHEKSKVPGAVAGEYRVTIIPSAPDQATASGPTLQPADLAETYKVQPGDNDFTLTYPGPN